jgi:Mg-chelatase subunit ChlD
MKNFSQSILFIFLLSLPLIFMGCNSGVAGGSNSNTATVPTPPNTPAPPENKTNQPSAPAKVQSNILFIIDSSGSMKAKMEDKTKMETAKEVLNNLTDTLPSETQVGLLAYGHRAKNDCKDTELLVPLAPLQADLFRQKVLGLQPLGQTPISYSLKQAAEVLKGKTGTKTIILVSDGEETCKADPCAVAAELKKAEIDLKVHVIGFGIVNASAKKQLTCIAESTGGTYTDAGNADDLKTTLTNVAGGESTGNKGRLVTVSLDSYGKPFPWCLDINKSGTNERVHIDCSSSSADLPPGIYDVQYYNGTALNRTTKYKVEIKAGQETRIEFEQAGRILVKALDQNGKEVDLSVQATPTRQDFQGLIFSTNKPQELIPDIYYLNGYNGPLGFKREGVEIKSGAETVIEVTINR